MNPYIKNPKIKEIGRLYNKVAKKGSFIFEFSNFINRSPNTLSNHWFGNFWSIPEDKQEETESYLKAYLKKQDKKKALELV